MAAPDADPNTQGHQIALNPSTLDNSAQTAFVIAVANTTGQLDSYTVTVTRAAGSSGDATLSALSIGDLSLHPAFDPATTGYTAIAGPDIETVTITATTTQPAATAVVAPVDADSGTEGHQTDLQTGDNIITAADETTTKTYLATVTVTRPLQVSNVDDLASLALTGAELRPSFGTPSFEEITMELPEGCVLSDLGAGNLSQWQSWDDTCDSLYLANPQRASCAARYYRLYVRSKSLVWLKVEGTSSSFLLIRSPSGAIIARDGVRNPIHYDAEVVVTLPRGVYVVEAAALLDHRNVPPRVHRLRYEGSGIIRPLEHQFGDVEITDSISAANIYTAATEYNTASVTVTAVAKHDDARVVVSPADADPDTPGHQVAVAAAAAGQGSAQTVVAVAVTGRGGTRSTYAVIITRPAEAPSAEITMELPEGCVLHELDEGSLTPRRRWDDNCDSLYNKNPQRAAQYYRLYVRRESLVRLKVEGDSSSDLLIRSPSGAIIARDSPLQYPQYYDAQLIKTLPRGVYVVEVAAHWHHYDVRGHRLRNEGEGIARPYGYRLDDLAISDVNLADFDSDTTEYSRNTAADVSSVTVTPTPVFNEVTVEISPTDSDLNVDSHQVALESDGNTDITVSVISPEFPDLITTYAVSLTQLAGTAKPLSDIATLSGLSLTGIDIGTFSSVDYQYSYTLGFYDSLNGLTTTFSPTTTNSGATWTISPVDADPVAPGHQVAVNGDDTITVTVMVADTETLSSDAALSALSVTGANIGTFNPATHSYSAAVANSVSRVTVSATARGEGAWVTLPGGDADTNTDGHQIDLETGANEIEVSVLSSDGTDTRTYTVTITRQS